MIALPAFAGLAAVAFAQAPAVRTLATPQARFDDPFSDVRGIRELSDGRVIVVDAREARITVADLRTQAGRNLSRTGQGPGEYTLPLIVHQLAGDSTFVLDMLGRGRGVLLVRDSVLPSVPQYPGATPDDPAIGFNGDQVDERGRVYSRVRPMAQSGMRGGDSAVIERLDRASGRRDTIAWVPTGIRSPIYKRPPPAPPSPSGGPSPMRPTPAPPFASFDQWAVATDGRFAIVTVDPYRVTLVGPDKRRTVGPVIAFDRVRVTSAEKEMWREEQRQPRPAIFYEAGGRTRGGSRAVPAPEPEAWEEFLPPFRADAVTFSTDGTLWVLRAMAAGTPPTFDVIDRAGRLSHRVQLPPRSKVVGFGNGTVYIVRLDDDDLQYLERHPLPR